MPLITQNDFLNPIFSLDPIAVALIIWSINWVTLYPIAWKTKNTILFRNPVGYFIMLPLSGFFITYFYQSIIHPISSVMSIEFTYFAIGTSLLFTITATAYSLFVTKRYNGVYSTPHTIAIFILSYILISFFSKGILQLVHETTASLYLPYLFVVFMMSAYIIFGLKSYSK